MVLFILRKNTSNLAIVGGNVMLFFIMVLINLSALYFLLSISWTASLLVCLYFVVHFVKGTEMNDRGICMYFTAVSWYALQLSLPLNIFWGRGSSHLEQPIWVKPLIPSWYTDHFLMLRELMVLKKINYLHECGLS